MISVKLQLYSWITSVVIGFFYFLFLFLTTKFIIRKNIIMRIILYTLFVVITSILLMYLYYLVNGGIIHYTFVLFWCVGYYLFFIVKQRVKTYKKTIFSSKEVL